MLRFASALLASALALAMPPCARAADLVVWWEEGAYPEETQAIEEVVAAFEQKTGKQVELVIQQQTKLEASVVAAVEAAGPPDFALGILVGDHISKWAYDDRLVELGDTIGAFSNLFDPDALAWVRLLNARTGQRALYGLPIGRAFTHLHVWTTLLDQAGFTLADIPREWEAFWAFWCDRVQPALRRATGRNDLWAIGLPMSVMSSDTAAIFRQFMHAYETDYVTPDGRLVIDDPEIRRRLVKAITTYTDIYDKGCTPPGSVLWDGFDNNELFHNEAIVITPNATLSVPSALRVPRPDDYYKNTVTIEWPVGPSGKPFPIEGYVLPAMVFKDADHVATAKEFVRFLVAEGWLAHYLNFSAERFLPAMSALLNQPFWLDPTDPHRMAAVMQMSSRPLAYNYATASGDWRHDRVIYEKVWETAVHRVAADGISPEQAVDEAIARVKEILSE